jgi:predicted acylesterase/phospholipase RssA
MKIIKNIIFSGGGFKGWAYIGTIRALHEKIPFKNIEHVIGVSIGSLLALLYILQIDYTILLDFRINLDIKKYLDVDIDSFLINQSLIEGLKIKEAFINSTQNKITNDTTFMELYNKTGVKYTTCAFNITKVQLDYFNKDLTPNVKIIDSIMASCALPLLFPAYCIENNWYYDGAVCNNCPCNLVDPKVSIAFDISSHNTQSKYKLVSLLLSLTEITNKQFSKINSIKYNIIDKKFDKEIFNLDQSSDTIFNIYMNGYKNTLKILNDYFLKGILSPVLSEDFLPKNCESNVFEDIGL